MPIINLCDVNAMSNLFQDKKTGKLVEFINKHDKEFAMVKDATGNITFVIFQLEHPVCKLNELIIPLLFSTFQTFQVCLLGFHRW